eukprot:m.35282 g.35282  ORF g.35282 m.35282 type:complete len:772 (+) comp5307_c0_seq1:45-2360(+)
MMSESDPANGTASSPRLALPIDLGPPLVLTHLPNANEAAHTPGKAAVNHMQSPALVPVVSSGPAEGVPLFHVDSSVHARTLPPALPGTPPIARKLVVDERAAGEYSGAAAGFTAPPLATHWFYQHPSGGWVPFSATDNAALDRGLVEHTQDVVTDGGRYNVQLAPRLRVPAYWDLAPTPVVRAAWLVRHLEVVRPLPEEYAAIIEAEFQKGCLLGQWHRLVALPNGDSAMLRTENLFAYYEKGHPTEPQGLRRGFTDEIEAGEPTAAVYDHLVLVLSGPVPLAPLLADLGYIGAGSLEGSIIDYVDCLRDQTSSMIKTHFTIGGASKSTGNVEILPVVWDVPAEVDLRKTASRLLLPSIGKLRGFLTDSYLELSDYLCNTQAVINAASAAITRVLATWRARQPSFNSPISFVGHGIGGCILFDLLAHQAPTLPRGSSTSIQTPLSNSVVDSDDEAETIIEPEQTVAALLAGLGLEECLAALEAEKVDLAALRQCSEADLKELGISMGHRKKIAAAVQGLNSALSESAQRKAAQQQARSERRLERRRAAAEAAEHAAQQAQNDLALHQSVQRPALVYPRIDAHVHCLFLLGCPLGLITTLQAHALLGPDFTLPTCDDVYNIFHPYDPMAYRLEPCIDPDLPGDPAPVLVPHHQGRKRIHLELGGYLREASKDLGHEVAYWAGSAWASLSSALRDKVGIALPAPAPPEPDKPVEVDQDVIVGKINGGRRVDYVLQENPLEIINENLFALGAHATYWMSEDTALFMAARLYRVA